MGVKNKPKKKFIWVASFGVVVLVLIAIILKVHYSVFKITNDAQIKSNMIAITPRVGGYIQKVYQEDNARVKKGDTLFTIEPEDYEVMLAQAKAQLAEAKNKWTIAQAEIGTSKAHYTSSQHQVNSASGSIESAKIKLERAQNDFERYQHLYENHSITRQQYEIASAAKDEAEQELEIAQYRKASSASQSKAAFSQSEVSQKTVDLAQSQIEVAKAMVRKAQLDLGYTTIIAPFDGQLSAVDIREGEYIVPGQSLFYLVNSAKKWVVANFKETQLGQIQPGQPVRITVDAFPGLHFKGEVANFSPATGSRFSLLPPDNATGNFVKTVQRLPIKIRFTNANDTLDLARLRSGMNVVVKVETKS